MVVSLLSPFPALTYKAHAQNNGNTGSLKSFVSYGFSFKKDLMLGDTDPDVKQLQQALNADADTIVAREDVGSPGKEVTYFGPSTKTAVIKFQEKYRDAILTPNGLTKGTGTVGKATRTKLNLLIGVLNTTDSTGLPQSRAGASVSTTKTVIATSTSTGPSQICQFVELLVVANIITAEKANLARTAVNCPGATSVVTTNTNQPTVDLKVNGSDGPVSIPSGNTVSLSWTSSNVVSCETGLNASKPLSGSVSGIAIDPAGNSFTLTCKNAAGVSVSDTVRVYVNAIVATPVSPSTPATSAKVKVLDAYVQEGYTSAVFGVTTDVVSSLLILYRTDVSTSTLQSIDPASTTSHVFTLENLKPNTKYYAKLMIIDVDGNGIMTDEQTFTTSATPTAAEIAIANLSQKVLHISSDGMGVVSVADSASLKTSSKLTVEAWVNPSAWRFAPGLANTNDSVIISKGNIGSNVEYALSVDNGKLVYSNNDASIWTCASVVPLNKWTHVAVSIDETSRAISLYVNGNKMGTGISTASSTSSGLCEGPRGVFSNGLKINRSNIVTEFVPGATGSTSGGWLSSNTSGSNNSSLSSGWGTSGSSNTSSGWGTSNTTSGFGTTGTGGLNYTNPLSGFGSATQNVSNLYLGNVYPKACDADPKKTNGFLGSLDDIKVWNTARTDAQIKTDMASTTNTSTGSFSASSFNTSTSTGPVAEWSFDDGYATDISGNGNTGAIKGTAEVLEDLTAKSAVLGSAAAGVSGLGFSLNEACDAPFVPNPTDPTKPDLYTISFKGNVKSSNKCSGADSQYYEVLIGACNNPPAEVVTDVTAAGGGTGTELTSTEFTGASLAVKFWPGLGMKVPTAGTSLTGKATYNKSTGETVCSANTSGGTSVKAGGKASSWEPSQASCMKPKKKLQLQTIVVIVVVAAVFILGCPPCALMATTLAAGIGTTAALVVTWAAVAGAASVAGGLAEKAF